jgi:hypothetical protein
MPESDIVPGGCLCGQIRLFVTAPPLRVGMCHCLDCRKHHGTLFHASAIFHQGDVAIDGTLSWFGNRGFCANCGSSLVFSGLGEIGVNLGAFDEIDLFRPDYELWIIRREAWLPPFAEMNLYEKDRD